METDRVAGAQTPSPRAVVAAAALGGVMLLLGMMFHVASAPPTVTNVSADEQLVFFSTYAVFDEKANAWRVHVHGWLFEPESRSVKRRALKAALRTFIGVPDNAAARKRFDERVSRFLVDNERGKSVVIRLGTRIYQLGKTDKAGHVQSTIRLSAREMQALRKLQKDRTGITYHAALPSGDKRDFRGRIHVVPPVGLSVVSDIDDTIKITQVTKRREMLANTFYRPFKAVPGIAELYRGLQKKGAAFHYVSASPWQLNQPLQAMLDSNQFPAGPSDLRKFRLADVRSLDQLTNTNSKKRAIARLLEDFPKRRFVFFGDSGERDPELYGEFARKHPKQIIGIFIRNVTREKPDGKRFREAFHGVDAKRWAVFSKPGEVAARVTKMSG